MELTVGNVNDVPRKMDHNICGWHSSSNFGFRMLNFTNFTSKGRLKSGVMIHRGILSVLVFVIILVKILLSSRRPVGSTDQAYPSCFYIRIS